MEVGGRGAAVGMDGIYITRAELEALEDAEGVLVKGYLWLRSRMDLRTGIVGRVTGISHASVAEHCEYVVRKGQGLQRFRLGDSPQSIKEGGRRVLERLESLGLLVKKGGPVLCFLCPLARLASVRPNQTGHVRATPLSTKRATPSDSQPSSIGAGSDGFAVDWRYERATPDLAGFDPNGPHIRDQGLYPPQPSSTDLTGVDACFGENAGGLSRDRATPSQACPLGRTGDYEEGVYRDRATPSHAGQLSQPGKTHTNPDRDRATPSEAGGPAHPLGTPADAGAGERPGGLAENESAPPSALSASTPGSQTLVEVLNRRAVRVPTKPDVLQGWVAMGVTPLELDLGIERALAERVKAGSQQRLNVGYVASIIQTARSEARRAAQVAREAVSGASRKRFDAMADLEAMAKQLGIPRSRPGESPEAFRARVLSAAEQSFGTADDVWGAR